MPGTTRTSTPIIDARPRGPAGPVAIATVQGRPVLNRLMDHLLALGAASVTIHAREEEQPRLRGLLAGPHLDMVHFAPGPPPEGRFILRADRLYDPKRLRRVWNRGGDPEQAVLWRLDSPALLAAADTELLRRRAYQPLGRFWAIQPARRLAAALADTAVTPNMLTLLAGLLMLVAALAVALGADSLAARLGIALALASALVLDTADGHLARLQGASSRFGQWLDATLDEMADMALHAAIAWAAYASTRDPRWLLAGLGYGMGKYLFFVSNQIWQDSARSGQKPEVAGETVTSMKPPSLPRLVAHWTGHADVRWHAWIILAACGFLRFELILFAAYYPLRCLGGALRKRKGTDDVN